MYALISPSEEVNDGYRVAQVAAETFEVAPPLFWVPCNSAVKQDRFFYYPSSEALEQIPVVEPPEPPVDMGEFTIG